VTDLVTNDHDFVVGVLMLGNVDQSRWPIEESKHAFVDDRAGVVIPDFQVFELEGRLDQGSRTAVSLEGRIESIARDAVYYNVPFEQFAQAVRESVDSTAIEEAALRLAMRSWRELQDLEKLFPDDGLTEPPPLVERVRELRDAVSPAQEYEEMLTCEKLAALFEEMRADYAAGKREDAHWYGKETRQQLLDGKTEAAAEMGKDKGIER
jgi:hypothetical protein